MNRLLTIAKYDTRFKDVKLVRWLFRVVLIIFLIFGLVGLNPTLQRFVFGLFFITLPFGIAIDLFGLFLRFIKDKEERRQAEHPARDSMAYATALLIIQSKNDSRKLWFLLVHTPSIKFLLYRLGLKPSEMYKLLRQLPSASEWIEQARGQALAVNRPMEPSDLFEVIAMSGPLTALWNSLGISEDDRTNIHAWYRRVESDLAVSNRGVGKMKFSGSGIGRDWTSGYTQALDTFGIDLTREIKQLDSELNLVGHDHELRQVVDALNSSPPRHTLLVGEEGVGKKRLLYRLVSNIISGQTPYQLQNKRVYMLDVGKLVTAPSQADLEMQLNQVFDEAAIVGNVIIIIPDLHLLVGARNDAVLGAVNAGPILSNYLRSQALIVSTTTPSAYFSTIKPNPALNPYFSLVQVNEVKGADALHILEDEIHRFERDHIFTYRALVKIIEIAERYVHDRPFPEKAIHLLKEVSTALGQSDSRFVLAADVERILADRLKVPIGQATGTERDILQNLETSIQSRIIGQSAAVKAVADALRRARTGLHSGKRPIGSFLFLGPTGVGKTEMAKTISALYYKNEKAFIRIDMSEYQTPESIEKLLGTKTETGVLTTAVTDQPHSVILLDEIEKATPNVRNIFLQILDDGFVTDGFGQKVDFTNSMIIATSNAGSELIRESVQQNSTLPPTFKQQLLEHLQSNGIFSPEWLNRFDAIITFLPLTQEEIRQVANLMVSALIEQLKKHNIELTVNDDVYDVLIERGYDPQFGARPMRRAVQDSIESALAKQLLSDESTGVKKITVTRDMLL